MQSFSVMNGILGILHEQEAFRSPELMAWEGLDEIPLPCPAGGISHVTPTSSTRAVGGTCGQQHWEERKRNTQQGSHTPHPRDQCDLIPTYVFPAGSYCLIRTRNPTQHF